MTQIDQSMKDKICMITGATSGIGEAAARTLAQMGAAVIVVGRSPEKSALTVSKIKQQTGNQAVEYLLADLSSQEEIRQLTQQFASRYKHLHVLVNNAGALFATRQLSVDGIEMTLALNHLNYFLLTNLLLAAVRASAPARIINVGASAHKFVEGVNFDDLQFQNQYAGWKAYSQSKLCNLLFTYELARRLEGTGITANTLHPGIVATRFGRDNPGLVGRLIRLSNLFAISPERGAQTIIYLASSTSVEGITGKYFDNKKETRSSAASYDRAAAQQLWQLSEAMTGL